MLLREMLPVFATNSCIAYNVDAVKEGGISLMPGELQIIRITFLSLYPTTSRVFYPHLLNLYLRRRLKVRLTRMRQKVPISNQAASSVPVCEIYVATKERDTFVSEVKKLVTNLIVNMNDDARQTALRIPSVKGNDMINDVDDATMIRFTPSIIEAFTLQWWTPKAHQCINFECCQ